MEDSEKKKEKKSPLRSCITNVKDRKQLQYYVEETMESESYSNNFDVDEENTVLEEYKPNWFCIVF